MSDVASGLRVKTMLKACGAALMVATLASGCSAISDDAKPEAVYGGTPAPAPEGAAFPDLRDVPTERPAALPLEERKGLAEGLVADRERAQHSDQVLRGGTEAPAPAPVVNRPTPVPALDDVPAGTQDKQSLYRDAPVLPLPERGGHRDYSAVLKTQTAAMETAEAEVMTEDGAAAAEPAVDTGPEVTPAPTKRVDVKPSAGQP
ncbi:hypothetical protein Plav_2944 [Parvibaculum lavamentivorans DS-1]|uniref:Uncharacterized protein n=1 Tax=Parvibaculum lavamentivorans (strain DS-1 / DSM 13023 / NCIMB 13966) TaxID=402881 RepID=A7HXB8_PARL1|nr:hypothetical protein [Parvibaculum lavamentivorans]ABS64551.1 hypothetical protein Plav_2944 [Parvibaculum lavamentivorans DS-1]